MKFDDELLEKLILDGIVEFAGLDKNGQMLYSFSSDIEEKAPEMFKMAQELHLRDIYKLWELGFVSMDATEQNPKVTLTKKAFNQEEIDKLDDGLQLLLEQIIEAYKNEAWE